MERRRKRRRKRRKKLLWFFAAAIMIWLAVGRMGLWKSEVGQSLRDLSERAGFGEERFWKNADGKYPKQLVELARKNPEARGFVRDYPKKKKIRSKIKLKKDDLKGNQGSNVPLLLQWDERWGYRKYGNDYMALTGCGPTCLSMVACYTFQNGDWNPWKVAKMAQKKGYYVDGQGSAWSLMTDGAARLGLRGTEMSCDEGVIRRTLQEGHVIICAMRPGDFTTEGHFLVLAGMQDDRRVIVNDPNSRKNSQKSWKLSKVVPQIKNLWKY